MSDTQWPRYEVFQQDRPGRSHENTGSVHAPDAEMALQNARDVFVRRPHCHSLWVVPAGSIFSKTAQEMAETDWAAEEPGDGRRGLFHVFNKSSQRRSMTFVSHVGDVEAASPPEALQRGLDAYDEGDAFVWWVFPATAVTRSEGEDVDSMFAPAEDKLYRQPNQYRTVVTMQRIKHGDGDATGDGDAIGDGE